MNFACPYCGKNTITLFEKFKSRDFAPVKCPVCAKYSYKHKILRPWIVKFVIAILLSLVVACLVLNKPVQLVTFELFLLFYIVFLLWLSIFKKPMVATDEAAIVQAMKKSKLSLFVFLGGLALLAYGYYWAG
ncbi:hypothetical protein SG34_026285 [Thalassomonas viridans]|uniref:Cxxc_20_cxxc protein n=1 Tax=Thalassomonas viridans TaxID=137584 RepID=A0AAE9Z197_9GAMM|nr:hypothetical protein [Thalassomonas viridans]WDE04780.1 hypothetical protein SG34_026285 [Thalassomonas viridans]